MIELTGIELQLLESLFTKWSDTSIGACLQGYMGRAWADHKETPKSAQILVGDFCYLAGVENDWMVRNIFSGSNVKFSIAVPEHEGWERRIESVYGAKARRISRFATKKEPDVFDTESLQQMAIVPQGYELKLFDEAVFRQAKKLPWAKDLCSQFADYETYQSNAIGVAALYHGELMAGASPYTYCQGVIEIEVDTREDQRRKGLARGCCAKLILECLKRRIYPSWDAHNKASLALAEQLGYHFDKEYTAYELFL